MSRVDKRMHDAAKDPRRTCRGLLTAVLLALSGMLHGCPAEEDPPAPAHFRVDYDSASTTLRLWRDELVLLSFPASGLQLGTVPSLADNRSYDPFFLAEEVTWHTVSSAETASPANNITEVLLGFGNDYQATLTLLEHEPGRVEATLIPQPGPSPIAFYRLVPQVDAQEGFYGLGGVLDTPEHV